MIQEEKHQQEEEQKHEELLHNISDFPKEKLHHTETEEKHVLPDDESRLFVSWKLHVLAFVVLFHILNEKNIIIMH